MNDLPRIVIIFNFYLQDLNAEIAHGKFKEMGQMIWNQYIINIVS